MSTFPAARSVKKHRSKKPALPELLNYAAETSDGIITLKTGAYLAGWIYRGEDNASATEIHREQVSAVINRELSKLGSGWMVHIDAIRRPAPTYTDPSLNDFPDPITEAIEGERRRSFERLGALYEGAFILTITFQPPLLAETKFVDMMFDDDGPTPDAASYSNKQYNEFQRRIKLLEDGLSSVLTMERLRGNKIEQEDGTEIIEDDLLSFLQFCISGIAHPVVLPPCPMYLDSILGGQDFHPGTVAKVGRNFIQAVAIMGFPSKSAPGILSDLGELPCEYRWSTRYIFMDDHEAHSQFDKFRRKWKQKIRGFVDTLMNKQNGHVDEDAVNMVSDASAAKVEINEKLVSYGFYTSVVILMSEDRAQLEDSAQYVTKVVNGRGFVARIETLNTVEAWLGSLPGHGYENVRRPLINTLNLADLMPTSSIWSGQSSAPCPFYPENAPALMQCATTGNTPFWLNLHVRDLGHTLIFGPTGAGKSVLLNSIMAQFLRYRGATIFAFDKGMSAYTLCKAANGTHYNIGGDGDGLAFCPLAHLETDSDLAWAAGWIDDALALQNLQTTPAQRFEILRALRNMRDNQAKTLTDLVSTIQDAEMREALRMYTLDGALGHLLDADNDTLGFNRFNVFEIEELMDMGDKYTLPVLNYLFRRIEKRLKGQPAMIVLDEAWLMLAHPAFRAKIREWLKVLRKANCIVVMATQNLSDAIDSGIVDVLKESAPTKIYLPNVEARTEETADFYKRLGLNSRQIDIITKATPKKHYYLASEQGRRLFDLALGPVALSFVGISDKDKVALVKQYEADFGKEWPYHWAKSRGVDLNDYVKAA
jgi:type IV secretion system protein VirB4